MTETALTVDGSKFERMLKVAELLSHDELLPDHLRGKKEKNGKWQEFSEVQRRAICFSIVNDADLFGCNPFQLAKQSYSVHGKTDYQGMFYAALANTRGGLAENLSYEFTGSGSDRGIIVSGRFKGETTTRTAVYTLKQGRSQGDSAQWDKDPEQRLIYAGARRWVKAYCPQVLIGLSVAENDDEPADVEIAADDAPRIEVVLPDYARRINEAESTGELETIAQAINDDESLSNDQRQLFLQMGRDAFKKFVTPKSSAFVRWDRTLKTSVGAADIANASAEIDDDESLSDDEKSQLGEIAAELLKRQPATA